MANLQGRNMLPTRINAAKALAPYQSKRVGGSQGKKQEKEEAAKKAGPGRFAPAQAPEIVPIGSCARWATCHFTG